MPERVNLATLFGSMLPNRSDFLRSVTRPEGPKGRNRKAKGAALVNNQLTQSPEGTAQSGSLAKVATTDPNTTSVAPPFRRNAYRDISSPSAPFPFQSANSRGTLSAQSASKHLALKEALSIALLVPGSHSASCSRSAEAAVANLPHSGVRSPVSGFSKCTALTIPTGSYAGRGSICALS